jgi:Ser/Thr protein kinase RdoA (MazF antagonist)
VLFGYLKVHIMGFVWRLFYTEFLEFIKFMQGMMVNEVDILINRWQQHRDFALQQKGAQDWLAGYSGGRKGGY